MKSSIDRSEVLQCRLNIGFAMRCVQSVEESLRKIGDGALGALISERAACGVWEEFLAGRTSWSRPWSLYVLQRLVPAASFELSELTEWKRSTKSGNSIAVLLPAKFRLA